MMALMVKIAEKLLGRSPRDGARCILDAAIAKGKDTHGCYLSECKIEMESPLVRSDEGKELQTNLWDEIFTILKEHGADDAIFP